MIQYVPIADLDNIHSKNEFALLVFSIDDNIKAYYQDTDGTICGNSWDTLFKVYNVIYICA
jgi:hypothetical protein